MKAFVSGTVVALVMAIAAAVILDTVNKPATTAFTTPSARISSN